jgi:hypothetical protein
MYELDGTQCRTQAKTMSFAAVKFGRDATTPAPVVPGGTTHTFALYLDTTGASSAMDDSIRVDIINEAEATNYSIPNALLWMRNSTGKIFNGTGIPNLHIHGGTLVF